jgi:hypothetical protein
VGVTPMSAPLQMSLFARTSRQAEFVSTSRCTDSGRQQDSHSPPDNLRRLPTQMATIASFAEYASYPRRSHEPSHADSMLSRLLVTDSCSSARSRSQYVARKSTWKERVPRSSSHTRAVPTCLGTTGTKRIRGGPLANHPHELPRGSEPQIDRRPR